jgi:hypothetical protein
MRANSFIAVGVVVVAGWTVSSNAFARKGAISEESQRRALLGQLAAATAEVAPQERTDADLMYEAMRQWHGEPRGSAAIDRALAQSKTEIRLDRHQIEEKVRKMFWKDPFSQEVVPVQKADRDLLKAHAVLESRVRGDAREDEVARLRDEIAATRAENTRLRNQLASAQQTSGDASDDASDGGASGVPTVTAQAECAAPGRHVSARRHAGGDRAHLDAGRFEALNVSPPRHSHGRSGSTKARSKDEVAEADAPLAAAPETTTALPPAGWKSSDPRGIIVVPIEAPIPIYAH